MGAAVLSSEERRKLFNTFMKEMNQSIVAQNLSGSNTKKKKRPNAHASESIQQIRGVSGSSSRPRSQLAVNQNLSATAMANNYASIASQGQPQANLKYKFVASGSQNQVVSSGQSRNHAQMGKAKDFFIHNTYNPQVASASGSSISQKQQ